MVCCYLSEIHAFLMRDKERIQIGGREVGRNWEEYGEGKKKKNTLWPAA